MNSKLIPRQGPFFSSILSFSLSIPKKINMIRDLSLRSVNIQTQKFEPMQCTVWFLQFLFLVFSPILLSERNMGIDYIDSILDHENP